MQRLDEPIDARAKEVADNLLASAARDGEKWIARARLFVGTALVIFWPIVHWDYLVALVPRAVVVFLVGWILVGWSLLVLARLRKKLPSMRLALPSIALDGFLANGMLLFFVIFPASSHDSIVEVHGSAFVYLAIVMAGARLSTAAAIWGAGLNSALFLSLVAISTIKTNDLVVIGPVEWISVCVGLVGSTILSLSIAVRTKKLVQSAASETLAAERAVTRLGTYVSPAFAGELLQQKEVQLGGKNQNVAVLFSDLRGFTSYSEDLEPADVVAQLNDYLSEMVAAIEQHGGVVDKFMGDGIMAVFGAPTPSPHDARNAITAAADMTGRLAQLNSRRQQAGLSQFAQGIGIHYGPVVAGSIGTQARASYTVIGDAVNLASRLESATKNLGIAIAISEAAAAACSDATKLSQVGVIQVPGRNSPVTVYTLSNLIQ